MADAEHGVEFYVGYLPTPPRLARFLRVLVPVAVGAAVAVGVMLARTQPDPGPAVWDDGEVRAFAGVVSGGPYPVLFMADRGDGSPGPVLVVEAGKHGSQGRLAGLAGRGVTVRGTMLRRGEGRMIELEEGSGAVREEGGGSVPAVVSRGRVTVRGEIVDSKCYLGAMKPGQGRPHKECATLCITGGVPPVLLFRAADGSTGSALLLDERGGPLGAEAYPMIADPVEVTGELEEQGGLLRMRVRTGDIVRL